MVYNFSLLNANYIIYHKAVLIVINVLKLKEFFLSYESYIYSLIEKKSKILY